MNEEILIRNEFKKLVIMGNHPECDTYEEALEKECWPGMRINMFRGYKFKMTIGRVMNMFTNLKEDLEFILKPLNKVCGIGIILGTMNHIQCHWKLQTPEGREATDDDQST